MDVHLINQGCSDTIKKPETGMPCVPEMSFHVNENLNRVRDIKWACKPSEGMDIWQQAIPPPLRAASECLGTYQRR